MSEQTEQTLKELKDKVDTMDQKLDAIIKHFKVKIETDYEHKGISLQIPGGPIHTIKPKR